LKSFCRVVILSLFLSCLPSLLFADPALTITGVVHDGSGALIVHAHVLVRQNGSSLALTVETGKQGEFSIEAPSLGSYQVEVDSEGFKPLTTRAVLTQNAPIAKLHLTLKIAEHSETVEVPIVPGSTKRGLR